jgi:hypothetical protein
MPLIPPETFEHLFKKIKVVSHAVKEAMLVFGNVIYIANGYAAGQQSSHFMLHIIPREQDDGLDFFTLKKGSIDKTKAEETFTLLKHNLPIMLRQRYAKYQIEGKPPATPLSAPVVGSKSTPVTAMTPDGKYTKESLVRLIESNEQLRQLVSQFPEDFKKQVQQNKKLQTLFAGVDLDAVITQFKRTQEPEQDQYSMDELVNIINDNPKLKDMLLKQTYEFAAKIQDVPELKKIFAHVNIEELERAVLARDVKDEEDVHEIVKGFSPETRLKTKNVPPVKESNETGTVKEREHADDNALDTDVISRLHKEMLQRKV